MDGVASSHLGLLSRICRLYGPAVILTNHRELPLSERRMVLYTYSAPDVSPADPCNKMAQGGTELSRPLPERWANRAGEHTAVELGLVRPIQDLRGLVRCNRVEGDRQRFCGVRS
jgi:hypothetical protein